MQKLFESLLVLLATATDHALAKQVQYLKVENLILRGKLGQRIIVTARERSRLVQFGRLVGSAIKDLISIVSPRTFARWLKGADLPTPARQAKTGRPRTDEEIHDLVLNLARATGWGYLRILGELKKLGVTGVSRTTVANILKAEGIDTGPKRGEGSWADFIKRQAATLWACDFFTVKVWTLRGVVDVFVLFFLHVGSRRVHLAGMTTNPHHVWVAQQARETADFMVSQTGKPGFLIRDMDGKFGPEFDAAFQGQGITVVPVGPRLPNMNAFAERWILSVREECLNHFVIFGEAHLRYLLDEYLSYYNQGERPHQGMDNRTLDEPDPAATALPFNAKEVLCKERLGGLLKHYYRQSAA